MKTSKFNAIQGQKLEIIFLTPQLRYQDCCSFSYNKHYSLLVFFFFEICLS